MARLEFPPLLQPNQVLADFNVCNSLDLTEAEDCGERMFCKNRLKTQGGSFRANFHHRSAGPIGVSRMTFGGDVTISPNGLDDMVLIQALIKGQEIVCSGDNQFSCGTDHGVIFNYNQHAWLRHLPSTEKLMIRIDRSVLEDTLRKQLDRGLIKDIVFTPKLSLSSPTMLPWHQTVAWAFTTLSTLDTSSPVLGRQVAETLATVLLQVQANNYDDLLGQSAEKQVIPSIITWAESYMREHAQSMVTVEDIASHIGVSSRAVFLAFKRFRGITPMQCLREIRLQHIRTDLESPRTSETSVSATALSWGVSHLGRFSAEYNRYFGESPSQTLKRGIRSKG